jgi:hypothetical protein
MDTVICASLQQPSAAAAVPRIARLRPPGRQYFGSTTVVLVLTAAGTGPGRHPPQSNAEATTEPFEVAARIPGYELSDVLAGLLRSDLILSEMTVARFRRNSHD